MANIDNYIIAYYMLVFWQLLRSGKLFYQFSFFNAFRPLDPTLTFSSPYGTKMFGGARTILQSNRMAV